MAAAVSGKNPTNPTNPTAEKNCDVSDARLYESRLIGLD